LEIKEIAAPDLVPAIENNDFETASTAVKEYATHFVDMDSLILGCTHYPLLKTYFRQALPKVRIISQDEFMGNKLKDYLNRHIEIDICLSRNHDYKFLVSSLNEHYRNVAEKMFPDISICQVEN